MDLGRKTRSHEQRVREGASLSKSVTQTDHPSSYHRSLLLLMHEPPQMEVLRMNGSEMPDQNYRFTNQSWRRNMYITMFFEKRR
jgi:hypothetical protein